MCLYRCHQLGQNLAWRRHPAVRAGENWQVGLRDLTGTFVRLAADRVRGNELFISSLCELNIPSVCTGSSWDGVNLLHSSPYRGLVCDNTSFLRLYFTLCPCPFPRSCASRGRISCLFYRGEGFSSPQHFRGNGWAHQLVCGNFLQTVRNAWPYGGVHWANRLVWILFWEANLSVKKKQTKGTQQTGTQDSPGDKSSE